VDQESHNSAGQLVDDKVGVKQTKDKIWLVSFMQYDLGDFDHENLQASAHRKTIQPKSMWTPVAQFAPRCSTTHSSITQHSRKAGHSTDTGNRRGPHLNRDGSSRTALTSIGFVDP
jgi:hypothetical protein